MSNTIPVAVSKNRFSVHEDWAVVILGFLIIIISLGGVITPVPSTSWSNTAELMDKVLSAENLLKIGAQFLLNVRVLHSRRRPYQ